MLIFGCIRFDLLGLSCLSLLIFLGLGFLLTFIELYVCDLLLAVNRRGGRSDYLPCICWGSRAREAARWGIGDVVRLEGRFQSRAYIKLIDGEPVEKTAYEVSAATVEQI